MEVINPNLELFIVVILTYFVNLLAILERILLLSEKLSSDISDKLLISKYKLVLVFFSTLFFLIFLFYKSFIFIIKI